MISVICEECGKAFFKRKADLKRSKKNFCSRKCFLESVKVKTMKICLGCGKEFSLFSKEKDTKFCSRSCSASYNNRKTKRKILSKICERCGMEFETNKENKKYCSKECFILKRKENRIKEFLTGELKDAQVRKRVIRKYLLERQGGVCEICGCKPMHNEKPLVFIIDHINGIFTDNRPENIRAICPNCNSQTDTFGGKNTGRNITKRA